MSRIWGALLWSLFLFVSFFLYTKEERRALAEFEGLCLLLSHIRAEMTCYLRPLETLYASFENSALERCGFLSVLRKEGLAAALRSDTLHIPRDICPPLLSFADTLGTHLLAEERLAVENACGTAASALALLRQETPRKIKLHGTLFLCGGTLLLLLLI